MRWMGILLLGTWMLGPAAQAEEVTQVVPTLPAWRKVPLDRVPTSQEAVALRIGIAADSFYQGRHIIVDVPTGPAFVAQIMRDPEQPADDGTLWFDAAVPFHAFNSTHPDLKLRFLLDEGCKPGQAVPEGRMPLRVTAVQARLAALAD